MSTKTSIKRVALVAVSALGFGLLSVVPAKAALATAAQITAFTAVSGDSGRTTATSTSVVLNATTNLATSDAYGFRIQTPSQTYYEAAHTNSETSVLSTSEATISEIVTTAGSLAGTLTIPASMLSVAGSYSVQVVAGTDEAELDIATEIDAAIAAGTFKNFSFAVSTVPASAEVTIDQVLNVARTTTPATGTNPTAAGTAVAITWSASFGAVTTGKEATFRAAITSKPATGSATLAWSDAANQTAAGGTGTVNPAPSGSSVTVPFATATWTSGASATLGNLTITPVAAVAGSYVVTVWHDQNRNGIFDAGETFNTITITADTAGAASVDFPDTGYATVAANDGLYVSSVGVTVTSASGRVGVPVGFAPGYKLTNETDAPTVGANAAIDVTTGAERAKLVYVVTNAAGTAVATYNSATSRLATSLDGGVQYVAPLNANNPAATLADGLEQAAFNNGSVAWFTPAAAGVYTITVYHDGGGIDGTTASRNDLRTAAEAVASATVTVAADGLPSLTGTVFGKTIPALSASGVLVKLTLQNGTAAANLGTNEVLTLTAPTGSTFNDVSVMSGSSFAMAGAGSGTTTQTLTSANFNGSGVAYVKVGNTATGTYTVTGNISGGTANGAAGSFTFSVIDTTAVAGVSGYTVVTDSASAVTNEKSLLGVAGAQIAANANGTWSVKRGVATTVTASLATTTKQQLYYATVTDSLGLLTGMVGATFTITGTTSLTTAPTKVTLSQAVPATTSLVASGTTVASIELVTDGADEVITVTAADSNATYFYTNPQADASAYTIRAGTATTNKFTVNVTDQFGSAMGGVVMTAAVAGRNSTVIYPTFITDAKGQFEISLADSYTGTFLLTDTITLSSGGTAKATITVNYATYLPAAKIVLTTPDSATAAATGIAGTVTTDIYAQDGAENGAVNVKAVVTDANGATLPAGIPVTFKVSDTSGSAILSTHVTLLTGADGSATTKVYGWKNGNITVTATSGAVTGIGIIYFKQADCTAGSNCAEARTVEATVSGNIVSAIVKDRYGNPIKGVNLNATRSGTGSFGGSSSAVGTTDKNGRVDFVLTGGTADVTVAFQTATFGQSYATKGYVDAGVTDLTAYTAGTVSVAEEGVGASFDAAGVNSVTVTNVADTFAQAAAESAADAAAEAIDAANAATDAANLAAEAADAATVAAEEARDAADAATAAVEELATQVATLMAALKAQITTLANTVAKIAKKVRA